MNVMFRQAFLMCCALLFGSTALSF